MSNNPHKLAVAITVYGSCVIDWVEYVSVSMCESTRGCLILISLTSDSCYMQSYMLYVSRIIVDLPPEELNLDFLNLFNSIYMENYSIYS